MVDQSGEPKSGALPSESGPAPVSTGAYKPQVATANAAAATPDQTAAQNRLAAMQQTGAPKKEQVAAAKPAVDGKQLASVVDPAKPATAAAQPQGPSSPSSPVSPNSAQPQGGAGGHAGTGSEGHGAGAGAGQQGGSPVPTAPSTPAGSSPGNVFSVTAGGTSTGSVQQVKLPEAVVRTSVTMQEAVDAVKATFTAANQAGISSARITLSPESLGGIKISLSQTPDGLIARVAADHPEAAQTLQQNAGDLKRSLEAGGMSLLRLDIGSSGEQSLGSFAGSQGDGSSTSGSWSSVGGDRAEEDTTSNPSELTVELPSGSLVNVLA